MADINIEYINPFLASARRILKDMCQIETKVGKPYVKASEFGGDTIIIMIGITGEFRGQVLIAFDNSVALDIASKMMMMPVSEMNEIATSAISEMGNMILGNAATILSTKGVGIDITPPTICRGTVSFTTTYAKNICVPLTYGDNMCIEIDIALKVE